MSDTRVIRNCFPSQAGSRATRPAPAPAIRYGVDTAPPKPGLRTKVQIEQRMVWGWVGVGALGLLGIAALTLSRGGE